MAFQSIETTRIGGEASDTTIGAVAHGLMMMKLTATPVPDEQCFEAIKAGIDALPSGVKGMLNSADFYAYNRGLDNLEMLSRFFSKYPEYADKTYLSVKGGMDFSQFPPVPKVSPEDLRKSVDNIINALGPNKKVDLFEPARIDKSVPIEEVMESLATLAKEGKFTHIGLSECSAATLRRAHAVHPVTAVEIEVSMSSYEQETKDVIATAKELGIVVVAYSPLGRGILTGQMNKSFEDGDPRSHYERFKSENLKKTQVIVDGLSNIALKKGISSAQLAIAWVRSLGKHVVPLPGSTTASRVLENLAAGNVKLSDEELKSISDLLAGHDFGHRYAGSNADLWG
ncbi:aldo/keto reductase [Coprinopsis sp. MPI-PUGE-AT-0042]|nr:aldo/keto reductase [Coprinopsis sp. MPI-PUGE-AT-0042]